MALPTLTASLDKTSYNVGDIMVMTVDYSDADNWTRQDQQVITGTDQDNNSVVVQITTTIVSADQVLLSIVDSVGRTWTKQSDNGSRAIYTAVA